MNATTTTTTTPANGKTNGNGNGHAAVKPANGNGNKPHTVGDGSVTVRPAKVLPAANPLKKVEADLAGKVKAKPAAKPAAKKAAKPAAKPARAAAHGVRFTEAFTRTFNELLGGKRGFELGESKKPEIVVFEGHGKRVEIVNPSQPGGSKIAKFTVRNGGGKVVATGEGRDALATALNVPKLKR